LVRRKDDRLHIRVVGGWIGDGRTYGYVGGCVEGQVERCLIGVYVWFGGRAKGQTDRQVGRYGGK
jgi:hypothetical protein